MRLLLTIACCLLCAGRGSGEIGDGQRAGDEWTNHDGSVFCWCPPGALPGTGVAAATGGFWLGKFELSVREFDRVTPMRPKRTLATSPQHPRDAIRYADVLQFIAELNRKERFYDRLPAGWEYALPSEAEWEYACRAGTTTRFSFGDVLDRLPQHGNFADRQLFLSGDDFYHYADQRFDDGAAKLAEVGSYQPNPWGLHDMHGNVWEWTSDLRPAADPERPVQAVVRGGSWASLPDYCAADFRHQFDRDTEEDFVGFRLALRRKPPERAVPRRR